MKNTAARIFAGAAIVVLIYCANRMVEAQLTVPKIQPVQFDVDSIPLTFQQWQGQETELDPKIFAATGADSITNRVYRNRSGEVVSAHVAIYSDPDAGVYHSPINCYRGAGWRVTERSTESISRADGSSIPVSLTTWERNGERIVVLYWFEIGEYVIFDRYEMGSVRWKMRNLDSWPQMVKVLLQTSAGRDLPDAKVRIQRFAQCLLDWTEANRTSSSPPDAPAAP